MSNRRAADPSGSHIAEPQTSVLHDPPNRPSPDHPGMNAWRMDHHRDQALTSLPSDQRAGCTDMVDSIESPETTGNPIPDAILQAHAIGAYEFGNSWPTYPGYCAARPDLAAKGWIVSITLTCTGAARCYDIEKNGGHNENIGRFMDIAERRWGLPWLYTYASNVEAMVNAAEQQGYHYGKDYLVWAAHANNERHICAPSVCGYHEAHGTQYGTVPGNCDISILNAYMLPEQPKEDTVPVASAHNAAGHLEVFAALPTGEIKHIWQEEKTGSWHGKPRVTPYQWENLGDVGGTPVGISAAQNRAGHVEVFVQLDTGQVKHCWQEAKGWHGAQPNKRRAAWEDLGNPGPVRELAEIA